MHQFVEEWLFRIAAIIAGVATTAWVMALWEGGFSWLGLALVALAWAAAIAIVRKVRQEQHRRIHHVAVHHVEEYGYYVATCLECGWFGDLTRMPEDAAASAHGHGTIIRAATSG